MSLKEVVEEAKEWEESEIEKHNGLPSPVVKKKAEEVAEKLDANVDITLIGVCLMDVKIPEALSKGKPEKHVEMSLEASKKFLEDFDLDQETKEKILNCVEAHHFNAPFKYKEAKICANADCYRFLHPRGFLRAFAVFKDRWNLEEALDNLEDKIEEKYENVSLDICKEETEKYYTVLKRLIKYSRQ